MVPEKLMEIMKQDGVAAIATLGSKGKAAFITSGPDYDFLKAKYSWVRANLAVTIDSAVQTW
ncbi:MAG: hypothetical protein HQL25_00265 [Candidatus Omnitrophica bacterium]|nr:hypothetical protein [Candidatus Omnitrophota bacterium]